MSSNQISARTYALRAQGEFEGVAPSWLIPAPLSGVDGESQALEPRRDHRHRTGAQALTRLRMIRVAGTGHPGLMDSAAMLGALGLLALYGLLTVLLISSSGAKGSILPIQKEVEPFQPPTLKESSNSAASSFQSSPRMAVDPRILSAENLLKEAQAFQGDRATYRQKLADLVRTYGNTPAGEKALNLLAAENTPTTTSAERTLLDKKTGEKNIVGDFEPTRPYRYGLRAMDDL